MMLLLLLLPLDKFLDSLHFMSIFFTQVLVCFCAVITSQHTCKHTAASQFPDASRQFKQMMLHHGNPIQSNQHPCPAFNLTWGQKFTLSCEWEIIRNTCLILTNKLPIKKIIIIITNSQQLIALTSDSKRRFHFAFRFAYGKESQGDKFNHFFPYFCRFYFQTTANTWDI